MKTKVRVQQTNVNAHEQYEHYYIQVLDSRYKGSKNLEVIGTITFQGTVSERGARDDYWYAMRFETSADRHQVGHMIIMAKIAKYIAENVEHNAQPEEILLLIGAEKYIFGAGELIPESYIGMRHYKVMNGSEYLYDIYAANDLIANKLLEKKYKGKGYTLSFNRIVTAIS